MSEREHNVGIIEEQSNQDAGRKIKAEIVGCSLATGPKSI